MVVVWRVTERCNLSCKFCGYDRELSRPRREADPQTMRDFGAVLSAYQRQTGDPVLVSWLGGEPLLWEPLKELTRLFRNEYQLALSTTTNGTCLGSPIMRAHLLENYSELTISVDAVGSLHNELRGWPGGFASLARYVLAMAGEKRIRRQGPVLRANVLLMRETLPGFEDLCLVLKNWGIEEVTFNQLGGNDRPEFYPAHRLLPHQAAWLAEHLPRLRVRFAAEGLRLHGGDAYLRRIQASARSERLAVDDCRPGQSFLFINEAGRIAPCSFAISEYGVPINELKGAQDLCRLPLQFSERRRQSRLAACEDCHSTQVFEKFAA